MKGLKRINKGIGNSSIEGSYLPRKFLIENSIVFKFEMRKIVNKFYFFVQYLAPVFAIAGVIFYLSAQTGMDNWLINPLEVILRKGAHFLEYSLLSLFLWRLFFKGYRVTIRNAFWFSLIFTILYAGLDELHQLFVLNRTGKVIDVVVDFFSAFVTLQMLLYLVKKNRKNILLSLVGVIILIGIVSVMSWQSYNFSKGKEQKILNFKEIIGTKEETVDLFSDESEKIDDKSNDNNDDSGEQKDSVKSDNIDDKVVVDEQQLPKKIDWKVPFMVQSPFAKWDKLHEEACEEASLIMLKYYNIDKKLDKQTAENEIQNIVKYQIKKYGDFYDTDMQITKEIGEKYFGLSNLRIIEDFEIVDLKKELVQGNIILIPIAGQELKNPYFSGAGPLYHNLVIVGYDDEKNVFITNDPGTKRGEKYKYKQELLYNAIHDFSGDLTRMSKGAKKAIVLVAEDKKL